MQSIDQEEETKEIIENGEDNNNTTTLSARPRRMSEIQDPPQPILPIPEGTSFFILSQGNRCDKQNQTIDQNKPNLKFKIKTKKIRTQKSTIPI